MKQTKKRRLEITIETRSLTIIRLRGGNTGSGFCPECAQTVSVFTRSQASQIFEAPESLLENLFHSQNIHAADGASLCGNSLVNYFK